MAVISRSLLLFFFMGALYWTCIQPNAIEPYFISFIVLFTLFVLYVGSCGAMPDLRIISLGLQKMEPGQRPAVCYTVQNIGDGEARNIQVETRINMTSKTDNGEAFSQLIPSRNQKVFLSKKKVMHKRLTLMRKMTADEIRMIEQGDLILSAYSIIRYKNEQRKVQRELRTCSVYDPQAKCFEKTFCLCVGEDWPHVGVNQPIATNYASC
ncbi:hypothetical protein [Candidatus Electrothrix sp.]|uniref:hypothetical protein n=1 Tax=Candidatus Electrothrix sp. TaxID=2170559 RepID=UPI00405669C2